jgi:uncharacterized protein with GYD domain
MLTHDPSWLERHRNVIEELHIGLTALYFTTHSVDVVFVVDAPDETAVARLGLALAGLGLFRIDTSRAYMEHEYRDLVAQSALPLQIVTDLDSLRQQTQELTEHHSDSTTTHLDDFSTIIILTGGHPSEEPRADLALRAGEDAMLKFAADISAVGFTYQQGLFNVVIEVHGADGTVSEFTGSGFLPEQHFFGVVAPVGIAGLRLHTRGSFYLQDFYFYTAQSTQR